MLPTYLLARDHLQRAAAIIQGEDNRSRQLRYIIERTVTLMDDFQPEEEPDQGNVLNFAEFRARSAVRYTTIKPVLAEQIRRRGRSRS